MKKVNLIELKDHADIFAVDVSPALSLLDPAGRRFPILNAAVAANAIAAADVLYGCGGAQKQCYIEDNIYPKDMPAEEDLADTFAIYYSSYAGRPSKGELTRAARIINISAVSFESDGKVNELVKVSGGRSIVFPDQAPQNSSSVPFLVSTSIWFNANRVTTHFPLNEHQLDLVINDINSRLTEGKVSKLR